MIEAQKHSRLCESTSFKNFLFLQVWPQIQRADPGDRRPLHGILLGPLLCQLVVFFAGKTTLLVVS